MPCARRNRKCGLARRRLPVPAALLAALSLSAALLAGCDGAVANADDAARPSSRDGASSASTAQGTSCNATPASMTPPGYAADRSTPLERAQPALQRVRDLPLPGRAARFDYQGVDSAARRLYISHMGDDHLVVVDLDSARVVANVGGIASPTGVLAVPPRHTVYVSAPGRHEVVAVDDRTLAVTARIGGIRFPDGIAYAPTEQAVFVSDESGGADMVIDTRTNVRRRTIALGGEAGNTHYDPVSRCILVAVQTRNQLVAIDPATERVVRRYDLPGSDHPHGFTLDIPGRLAFVSSEGNDVLQVLDLRTMQVLATYRVGEDPDVLAWDAAWRRLYVASEGGVVSIFDAAGDSLRPVGEIRAPHAHTVAVDPATHRVYLPLQSVNGRPVLRILAAAGPGAPGRAPARTARYP